MNMPRNIMAAVAGVAAIAIVATYCATTLLLMFFKIPADNNQLFSAAQTALVAMAVGIIGFFYGGAHEAAKNAARSNERIAASTDPKKS
ncbi:hypothetical protein [Dyella sp.]|uniref:hypothetical protein n=1 Tax=Dyella sp. TaxID=1869338 RepID=UPI002D78BFB5|nr:hypothetical protein [Dyella sp.]HET7332343.1 hypothetical protein [Dyella sp.]